MQINRFDGGLNKRLSTSLTPTNEAKTYSNIDNSALTLKSAKGHTKTTRTANNYFYIFKDKVYQSDKSRDYLEYNNKLYWTEQDGIPSKVVSDTVYNLGISAPVDTPAVDEDGDPIFDDNQSQIIGLYATFENFVDTDFIESQETISGSLSAGTYNYRIYVYVDTKQIYTFDRSVTVGASSAVQFNFKTDHKIQLTKKVGSDYKLVMESTFGTVTDNGQTPGAIITTNITTDVLVTQWCYTYYNSTDGTESAPSQLTEEYNWPLAKKALLHNFTVSNDPQVDSINIYRISTGITVPEFVDVIQNVAGVTYYDYKQNVDLTTVLDTFDNQKPLEGLQYLVEAYGIMFGAFGTKLCFSLIGTPDYWPAAYSIEFGFIITGLLPVQGGILVFSATKTYILVGTTPDDFQKQFISDEQGCISHKSCKTVKGVPIWASFDGICAYQNSFIDVISRDKLDKVTLDIKNTALYNTTYFILLNSGGVLAYDLRFGAVFKEFYFENVTHDIGKFDNSLYINIGGTLYTMFDSTEDLVINYRSPDFSEGFSSMSKLYSSVYIKYKGTFEMSLYVDEEKVSSHSLHSDKYTLEEVKPPIDDQSGSVFGFSFRGKGEVVEVEYKTQGRQNGR